MKITKVIFTNLRMEKEKTLSTECQDRKMGYKELAWCSVVFDSICLTTIRIRKNFPNDLVIVLPFYNDINGVKRSYYYFKEPSQKIKLKNFVLEQYNKFVESEKKHLILDINFEF